jgi:glycosyltransferase involved in cell wall biosynthesis
MLNIIHLSYTDGDGGAGRAALRIFKLLRKDLNFSKKLYVNYKTTFIDEVIGPKTTYEKLVVKIRSQIGLLFTKFIGASDDKTTCSFAILPSKYPSLIKSLNPDIVHMHWVGAEYISINDIQKINKPIIWTLHDMWPISGSRHVAHNENINKYFNYDEWVIKRKIKNWSNKKFYLVAPSRWMANKASASKVFSNREIFVIPNPIDISIWKPVNKNFARDLLGLSKDNFYILFGAYNGINNHNKNFKAILNNLDKLKEKITNVKIVALQSDEFNINNREFLNIRNIIRDDESMVALYNAVDMVVMPSYIESFGQMATEAQACGIPVVGYNSTGLMDIITHKKNGYLAEAYDENDLINGIFWVNKELINKSNKLKVFSRENAVNNFSNEAVSKKYIKLYEYVQKNSK